MTTLTLKCPDRLAEQLEVFVKEGWATDTDEAVTEALRRFLESHHPEIVRSQVLEDLDWGLHGED